ncbi:hypothetical protein OS190_14935 [Sulfitobacter sp. F26204]|uniref:hypothetical protein n=1 Tax=Sulfitobacter sp. F26204 TaxID=2996014 RepID=UPI00225DFD45|nr:hypothetical protein [Sulfitobacter sp. F26204]MCX7560869.1 hypothetical protein [Sulfitobacter sp. F26204]
MPKIFRFYFKNCLIGFGVAAAFVGGVLWFNVANLWHLISTSDVGLMAVVVFWVLNGIVFAGVQTGVAVMLMTEDEDQGPMSGTPVGLIPIRQTATSAPDRNR